MSTLPPAPPDLSAIEPADAAARSFLPQGRSVPAGNGWQWIVDGWGLFRRAPGMWIVLLIVLLLVLVPLSLVPLVGGAAAAVLAPVLTGGLMLGCKALDEGRPLQIEHLFAGFREGTQQLAVVGVFHLLATIAIVLLMMLFVGANVGFGALMGGMMGHPGAGALAGGMLSMLFGLLIGTALAVPVYAAIWFAPALIVFHQLDAIAALKASFFVFLKNLLPMLVYGCAVLLLAIVAAIPFSLGFLVLAPVLTASIYASYRDLFLAP
jgi:uncharacterized membrane protein